nr:MAG TPA: hypothetical protein [Caudoviricetes sp.]
MRTKGAGICRVFTYINIYTYFFSPIDNNSK